MASSPDRDLAGQLRLEEEAVAACADSPEGREGVAAFLQRRAPEFRARTP
jgi:2-(1,2-epoxy-1,2-dihydrophenyl)acetyl-CoA isomerase